MNVIILYHNHAWYVHSFITRTVDWVILAVSMIQWVPCQRINVHCYTQIVCCNHIHPFPSGLLLIALCIWHISYVPWLHFTITRCRRQSHVLRAFAVSCDLYKPRQGSFNLLVKGRSTCFHYTSHVTCLNLFMGNTSLATARMLCQRQLNKIPNEQRSRE